ncbi:MAG TPA: ATP-binding protein, partial [Methylomirabilota bacterium]|nr:ATP-binding protein [Methylomirabilota bacterium]
MTATTRAIRDLWHQVAAALPRGHGLPQRDWERRHRGMLFVLWAHAAGIFLYVLLRDRDLLHAVVEGGVVSIAGLVASWPRASRRFQAISVCVGLLTSSAILVHLSGGYIEMHFHFFVMVPLMALYQDWVPFLAAIAYVVLHHGTVGVLDASQVYNHPAAWASPWRWAAIHGVFVLGASVVSCIAWRLNELAAADAAASAQRFQNLVQNLDAVVWEADPDMERFTFMSRQAEPVLGIPAARWAQERGLWKRLIHPEDRERTLAAYDACVRGTGENQFTYRIVTDDRRVVHVSDVVHVERDEVGYARQLRGVTVDTTGRRTLEEQLRQSQKMEAIGRLAAGVAHDFNNLLSVIIGRTEMLRARHAALGTPLDLIASTAQKAAALTRQLLAFGRQQVLEARVLDFGAVVRGLAPMLRRVVREDIELLIEISGAGHVEADPVQIEQVVLNLVVNACDAMPSGGRLTIEVDEVELGLRPDGLRVGAPAGRYVSLRVSDTGIGMDETTLANIFEPFFTTKDVGKGTGLGLATVYGIVTQSNGDIRVDSAPGRGTSFTIYLPRVDAPLAPTAPAPTRERNVAGTETIMLVEDEPDVRALMHDVLGELGYQVLVAGSSEEALRLADDGTDPVDLLITDVVMSGMNGIELAERFTMKRPATKVLYMTGYSHEAVAGLGALRGSALLQKPFRPNDLALRVREVLD